MKLQKTINIMKRNFATHADYRESGTRNGGLIPRAPTSSAQR